MTTALAAAVRAATSMVSSPEKRGDLCGAEAGIVTAFGSLAGLVYDLDAVEVRRRASFAGPTHVPSLPLLDTLMSLPVDQDVVLEELTDRQRQLLQQAPAGAVEVGRERVVRRVVAPISVRLALVAANDWKSGLKRADRFGPFCARAVLLPRMPDDIADLMMNAAFYGTGVCVLVDRELHMVVEPRAYVRRRHTPSHWRFAEDVYFQLRVSETAAGPTR
jgi:hypothetical protein